MDINFIWSVIQPWFMNHGIKILIFVVAAYFVGKVIGKLIERVIRKVIVSNNYLSEQAEKKREDTLIRVFEGVVKVLIWLIAIFMIMSELGINIGPFLAGAGVAGLAIGFGAQYVIRDFITGFFIIMENQYRVGDVVGIGDIIGEVEDINLRMTILRDVDGTVYHVPNGEISIASNWSKKFARVHLKIGIGYDSDLEHVEQVVNRVGQELAADSAWQDKIQDPPKFVRVDDFGDSAIIIKILGDVKPLEQWNVAGELRKRLKIAFDKENIEIPFPQRVIRQIN